MLGVVLVKAVLQSPAHLLELCQLLWCELSAAPAAQDPLHGRVQRRRARGEALAEDVQQVLDGRGLRGDKGALLSLSWRGAPAELCALCCLCGALLIEQALLHILALCRRACASAGVLCTPGWRFRSVVNMLMAEDTLRTGCSGTEHCALACVSAACNACYERHGQSSSARMGLLWRTEKLTAWRTAPTSNHAAAPL